MTRIRKPWMAVVMGALLVGTLVGVVWARPHDRPQAQDITRKVVLVGSEFMPRTDETDWFHNGNYMRCNTNPCFFAAPVVFPCLPAVTVERIKLHVYDANAVTNAVAEIKRLNPNNGATALLGKVSSPVAGTTANPQTFISPNINKVVWPSQRAFVWLYIGGSDIRVYAITVEYHRNI